MESRGGGGALSAGPSILSSRPPRGRVACILSLSHQLIAENSSIFAVALIESSFSDM